MKAYAKGSDPTAEGEPRVAYQSIFREGLFAGQVIIVTGGGSGIGRCTAHELAASAPRVALVGRKPEKLATVAAEIAEDGGKATTHACDIREEEAVAATVAAILKAHGRIDGLVNNAGGQFQAPLEAISQKGWETVVRTNLTGGFLMARECYTQWMREHGGAIVNIVADMWNGMPGMGHSRRGAGRHGQLHRDGGRRVGRRGRARQRRGAGLDRLLGLRHLSRRRQAACCARCAATRPCSASARRPRCPRPSSSCSRRPPPSSPARRCASTAPRPTPSATSTLAAARPLQALERLPPRRAPEDAAGGVMIAGCHPGICAANIRRSAGAGAARH